MVKCSKWKYSIGNVKGFDWCGCNILHCCKLHCFSVVTSDPNSAHNCLNFIFSSVESSTFSSKIWTAGDPVMHIDIRHAHTNNNTIRMLIHSTISQSHYDWTLKYSTFIFSKLRRQIVAFSIQPFFFFRQFQRKMSVQRDHGSGLSNFLYWPLLS